MDETLIKYISVIKNQYKLVILTTSTMVIISIVIAVFSVPIYKAEVLIIPVASEEKSRLSSVMNQFGGLASIAGMSVNEPVSIKEEALATLRSRKFLFNFIVDNSLLQVFYEDLWDDKEKDWVELERNEIPTYLDVYEILIKNVLKVYEDKKNGLIRIVVEWRDSKLAATWANELVNRVNNELRNRAILEAEQSITYLENELAKTSIVEIQRAIYGLIEIQVKNKMLANVREQYAFKIVDPAVPPEDYFRPRRTEIVLIGFSIGVALSLAFAFLAEAFRK